MWIAGLRARSCWWCGGAIVARAGKLLIPFVAEYVIRVDAANRLLEMRLPEGLLEINAPMTEEEKREAGEPHGE